VHAFHSETATPSHCETGRVAESAGCLRIERYPFHRAVCRMSGTRGRVSSDRVVPLHRAVGRMGGARGRVSSDLTLGMGGARGRVSSDLTLGSRWPPIQGGASRRPTGEPCGLGMFPRKETVVLGRWRIFRGGLVAGQSWPLRNRSEGGHFWSGLDQMGTARMCVRRHPAGSLAGK
jgi:hypothetical protein